jgi:outer membrane protein assembly factor BamB
MPPRFQRLRKSLLIRPLKWLLTRPFFWAAIIIVLTVNWGYGQLAPHIVSVPLVRQGGEVIIDGQHFGAQQGNSYLVFDIDQQQMVIEDTVSWSDTRIDVKLPVANTEGSVYVVRRIPLLSLASNVVAYVVQAAGLPSQPYGYEVPVQAAAPWPLFRRDQRNTANSPLPAIYQGDQPWSFRTGKGVFSTPVIDEHGVIYVGSADHNFYALNPDGTEKFRFTTGEIIDSAGALPRHDPAIGYPTVIIPSGDGHIYHIRTDAEVTGTDRLVWAFDAKSAPGTGFNNWFEGNIGFNYDGTILAGNTNFNYYALNPAGTLKWTYPTGSNNWSIAGLGDDGMIYWGSNDLYARGVQPNGQEQWRFGTWGFIAASAAIGSDGTVYIPSFDSMLYALDPHTGAEKWHFKTNDHIYASAALAHAAAHGVRGATTAIYFGSADGTLYALRPDGSLLWKYDTGDVIRSSPVIGRTPDGSRDIIYFGDGNGQLYALNADGGTRRWSFDTTPDDPELRDRNDLNGSPALGKTGLYLGGETGDVWYMPYDYCLHVTDSRCQLDPHEDLPADMRGLLYVTPGGNTRLDKINSIPAATMMALRLMIRRNGDTVNAWVCNAPIGCGSDEVKVSIDPPISYTLQHSADGKYLYLRPIGLLTPGQTYTVSVAGNTYTGGSPIGNLTLFGSRTGTFSDTLTFKVEPAELAQLPLKIDPDRVSALEWTRLAAPIPTMLPSLNQIGFDYIDWIIGAVDRTPPDAQSRGQVLLWAVGAKRDANGVLVADPQTRFALPLVGEYQNDAFIVSNQKSILPITEIPIPFDLFELRGRLGNDLKVKPGASAYAETPVLSIPNFGPKLVFAGLANNWIEKLTVMGTYITRPYDERGAANRRPDGLSVSKIDFIPPTAAQAGKVTAHLQLAPGASYPGDQHLGSIVLIDEATLAPVYFDYHTNLSSEVDASGNLSTITLTIPAGTKMPTATKAMVIVDVFPLHEEVLH